MSSTITRFVPETFAVIECYICSILFAVPEQFNQTKLDKRHDPEFQEFYCPSGHRQCYIGKTKTQIAQEALAKEKAKRIAAETERARAVDAAAKAQAELRKSKQRVGNGTCPCCKRHFKALRRHMACKHPEYKAP